MLGAHPELKVASVFKFQVKSSCDPELQFSGNDVSEN